MTADDARAALAALDAAGACGAPTLVVFEVPAGVTTRSAVELLGAPRYARVGASKWRLFYGDAVWCAINGDASWSSNPWVWRIEFKRVEVTCG